ncbi:MAG: signal peptidase I [Deltaproteobacteria bacterium]|nr:signal peptidase I [Deltaproteobacteria bacterium]
MSKPKSKVQEYIEAIVIAVVIAFFIRTFVIQAYKIPSGSMKPTLQIGDHILVSKFNYGVKLPFLRTTLIPIGTPKRGDILVFIYPEDRSKDFIKRLVGLPGDTVEVRDKQIFLNGQPWKDDTHGVHSDRLVIPGAVQPRDNFGPVTVPTGSIFVMGDNRDESYDSRFWGFVKQEDILGKALVIYWSWNSEDHWVRWNRIGTILH